MGCADTLTLQDGSTLTLPEHEEALEKALKAQRAMSGCVRGSRQWKDNLECLRTQRRAMQHRDHDAVHKTACEIAQTYSVLGLESLNIKGMGTSARARSDTGVGAKRALKSLSRYLLDLALADAPPDRHRLVLSEAQQRALLAAVRDVDATMRMVRRALPGCACLGLFDAIGILARVRAR